MTSTNAIAYSPRRAAERATAHHLSILDDRADARHDWYAQARIVDDLQQRLERARAALADDRRRLDDIERDTYDAEQAAALYQQRAAATIAAAQQRAKIGLPAIRPLWPLTQLVILPLVILPSRANKYPMGSTPRQVMVENAWLRRRRFQRHSPECRPAVIQAHAQWAFAAQGQTAF